MTFEEVYEAHHAAVFHWALRYSGGDPAVAEDLMHDVFLKVLEALPGQLDWADIGGWLYRVTVNRALNYRRHQRSVFTLLERFWVPKEPAPLPSAVFEQHRSAQDALTQLRTLPERERIVLCMKILDGQSQREIATTLSLSEGYVSKLIARGLSRLRAAGWEVSDETP